MTFESSFLEPKSSETREGIVGVYAVPIATNIQNAGDRLQTMVDLVGIPFLISDLLGQNRKKIFDMSARKANQPNDDQFRSASLWRKDFLDEQLESHTAQVVLGFADSLGVPAIQGIQYHSIKSVGDKEAPPLFNTVVVRDGWNLTGNNSLTRNIGRYVSYTIKDELQKRRNNVDFKISEYGYKEAENWPDETNGLQKILNVADLMRSPMNARMAVELAGMSAKYRFGMSVVCLEEGLSGTPEQQDEFIANLRRHHDMYRAEIRDGEVTEELKPSMLRAKKIAGWHSELMNPHRAALDIEFGLDLLN